MSQYSETLQTVLDLVGLISEAITDPSRWQTFLDAFVQAVGARTGTLALRDASQEEFGVVRWSGLSEAEVQLYGDKYAATDPWRLGSARWPEGLVGTDVDLCPRTQMESSTAFKEFYAPRDFYHGMGGTILLTSTGQSLISVTRGATAGPFGESEKAILRPLLPHLRQAALIHGELGFLRSQLAAFTGHLDRYPHAFLLTDGEGRVLYANSAAREFMELRDGLAMDRNRISLPATRDNAVFLAALRAIASGRDVSVRRLEVSRPSGRTPFRLMLMPAEVSRVVPLGVSVPTVTVVIADSEHRPEPDLAVLCELFSLTPAEARVAAKLVQGRNVEEIAAEAGISVATVRTHIKRTLAKTSTYRQGELIALILRLVPFLRQ